MKDSSWWSLNKVQNGPKWFKTILMVKNGPKWSNMFKYGPKWHNMVQCGPKSYKNCPKGSDITRFPGLVLHIVWKCFNFLGLAKILGI